MKGEKIYEYDIKVTGVTDYKQRCRGQVRSNAIP